MLYSVEEVASKLSVSKQAIYNKLKLKEFKDKVLVKQGQMCVDVDLFNLIKDSLKVKKVVEQEPLEEPVNQDNNKDSSALINRNNELINALIEQLKIKDAQISELHNRLAKEQELQQNLQVILKREQDNINTVLAIEERHQEVNNALLELRERIIEKQSKKAKNPLKKFFSK